MSELHVSDQARDDEREALEAFVLSKGWSIILAYLDRNWGPRAYRERSRRRLHDLPPTADMEQVAQLSMLQIEAVTDAMEALARFPTDRIKVLKKAAEQPNARRRRPHGRGATPNE